MCQTNWTRPTCHRRCAARTRRMIQEKGHPLWFITPEIQDFSWYHANVFQRPSENLNIRVFKTVVDSPNDAGQHLFCIRRGRSSNVKYHGTSTVNGLRLLLTFTHIVHMSYLKEWRSCPRGSRFCKNNVLVFQAHRSKLCHRCCWEPSVFFQNFNNLRQSCLFMSFSHANKV